MNDHIEMPDPSDDQIPRPQARRTLRTSDHAPPSSDDLAGMFGRWKEADHCDKN